MAKEEKRAAKERIFDAATSLFARKGFAAVGTREIAKEANVNISMINYYFDGKVGILKAIINECYEEYYQAIFDIGDENTPVRERVRLLVRNLVQFFRANTELAMVAFNAFPIDIPEIVNLQIKWLSGRQEATHRIFTQFGLDTNDIAQMGVIRGLLTSIVSRHFQGKYAWTHLKEAPNQSEYTQEYIKRESCVELNDAFYERYSELLSSLYFHGLKSIVAHGATGRGGENAQMEKGRGGE